MLTPSDRYRTLGQDVWKQLEIILQCATDDDAETLVALLQDPSVKRHHTIQLSSPGYCAWTEELDIVNVKNIQPNTAITVAVMRQNTKVVRALLEFRADINPDRLGDEAHETLFDLAKENGDEDMMTILSAEASRSTLRQAEASRSMQRQAEASRSTQRNHAEASRSTQRQAEASGSTQKHAEARRRKQKQAEAS